MARISRNTLILGGAAVLGIGALVVWLRRRSGEGFATTLGRGIGEGAIDLAGGILSGTFGALEGALEGAVGVTPFRTTRVPGRELSPQDTNILRLQGILREPRGEDSGFYAIEVQNNSDVNLSGIRIELLVDKAGLDAVREPVATVDIPARTGIAAEGTVLIRSVTGILPVVTRLFANGYLLDKTDAPLAGRA